MLAIKKNEHNNESVAFFLKKSPECYELNYGGYELFREFRIVTEDVAVFLQENIPYTITEKEILVIDFLEEKLCFDIYSFNLYLSNERNYCLLPKNRKRDWRGYFVDNRA